MSGYSLRTGPIVLQLSGQKYRKKGWQLVSAGSGLEEHFSESVFISSALQTEGNITNDDTLKNSYSSPEKGVVCIIMS